MEVEPVCGMGVEPQGAAAKEQREDFRRRMVTLCIGGSQGVVLALEAVS